MDDAKRIRLARTFDSAAELYDRVRPRFPDAALDWVLPVQAEQVLDLGAGTGKLTRSLVDRGLDVIAIDPSPNMLERLRANLPDVDARIGTAEATGLPDQSVDAVVAGSAFHWFARPAADAEIARILRPGGAVGLLWNRRDPASETAFAFDVAQAHKNEPKPQNNADVSLDPTWFGRTERRDFPHSERVTPQQLVDLVSTRSYVIDMDESERRKLLDNIRRFIDERPELAGQADFELAYLALARRATVLARPA
ncbi:MAG: SAM-dependent methyltransferase [Pseudonocardiales bacterium]|nr:SAM-dependent methyltransferase [Pseudonocardiales bacterium]